MKKGLRLLAVAATMLSSVACGGKENNKIHLQLVPSVDPTTLLTRAKALAPILSKFSDGYEFTIDVGTDYTAVATALTAGQIDGGFITPADYAKISIEHPNDVSLLLSAARAGYKVQADDFPGLDAESREKQRQAMNGKDNYEYYGQQSETLVSYYCSIVITLKDSERTALGLSALDTDGDGEVSLAELHAGNAVWGTMGATSSSGYLYPAKYIYENGYTGGFIDKQGYSSKSAEEQAKYMIFAKQESYTAMVENLMSGQIDVAVGYFDIRYGAAFTSAGNKFNGDKTLFTKTYTQAVLDPIMNDTVCSYSGLSDAKKEAIKKALKAAVQDGDIKDDGDKNDVNGDGQPSGRYLIYQIYSHTGYVDGIDADYDAARSMYRWNLEHSGN